MKIRKGLLKFVSPETTVEKRLDVARRGDAELDALAPEDIVTVLFVLTHDKEPAVSDEAKESLRRCPADLVLRALEKRLDPLILRNLYTLYEEDTAVKAAVAKNPGADEPLLYAVARRAPMDVISVFGEKKEIVKRFPSILEGLKKNPEVDEVFIKDIESFFENTSLENVPEVEEPEPAEEPTPDYGFMDEDFESDRVNIYQLISNLTAGEKIKLALTGEKSVRDLLIKDKNKIVAMSVLKNPRITEQEIVKVASSTTTSDDILREIATRRDWIKNYIVKLAMVLNPKTPLNYSLKFLDFLHDRDLKKISKSKNVPAILTNAAQRKLVRKGRG
ncbi:MAG: hypothetical protein BMS9Abin23_0748 [Thermodesulfobacteriota bacterium]|nr:MAG: hypothetical protein BMS9Abin23_0748 [Thermodesulfobacteriota bacterium]